MALSGAFWKLENEEEKQKQLEEFKAIVNSAISQATDLIEDGQEEFPNYEKKIKLIELLHDSWISSIKSILEMPDRSFKTNLQNLPFPFEDASGLFVGRGASPIFQKGLSFEKILGNNWLKQTFLAIQGGAQAFRKKQKLYLLPIGYEEFNDKKDSFSTVFHFGNYIHYFFSEVGPFRFFILLDLKKISAAKIRAKLREFILSKNKKLALNDKNLFIHGDSEITLPGNFPGVRWKSSSFSYIEFLKNRTIWVFLYLALVIWLYQLGGYRLLFLRFESKLFLALMVFMSLLFICVLQVERQIIRSQTLLDIKAAKTNWRTCSKDLEKRYTAFQKGLREQVREVALQEEPFKGQTDLWKYGLHGLYFQPPNTFKTSGTETNSFTSLFLLRLSIQLLATNDFLMDEMGSDVAAQNALSQGTSKAWVIADFIKRKYAITEFEKNIPDWLMEATKEDPSFNKDISGEGKFILGQKGDWIRYKLLSVSQYFSAELKNLDTGPRLLTATINEPDLFARYFREKKFDQNVLPADSILMVQMPSKELFTFPEISQKVSAIFPQQLAKQRHQNDSLVRAELNGEAYLGSFYKSELVSGFRYLILQKEKAVKANSILLENRIREFYPCFWVLGLVVFVWLGRSITQPLERIREGFLKLNSKNFNFQIHHTTANEAGEMIRQFNSMVQDLNERERMLPYVNSAVMNLLDSLGEQQKHKDRAVILVSDIRSFTTLCDVHPPEKIVAMLQEYFTLWQERIEKHGGIIERFIGDAVVAIYFESGDKHFIQSAIQSALEVYEGLTIWNEKRSNEGLFMIRNGVGLSLGEIEYGLVGTNERLELMSLGKPVAKAEELEALSAKGQATGIFVDQEIAKTLNYLYDFKLIDENGTDESYFELARPAPLKSTIISKD